MSRCVRAPTCHAIAHQSMHTQLDIPWKNLRSRPVVVTITGLYVVVCPQHEPARSAEEQQARALAAKRAAIAELDAQGPDGVRALARSKLGRGTDTDAERRSTQHMRVHIQSQTLSQAHALTRPHTCRWRRLKPRGAHVW